MTDRGMVLERLYAASPKGGDLAGRTLFVTGSSGQIGLNIIGMALARGAKVISLYNKTRVGFAHPNLTWEKGDLSVPDALYVPGQADMIIHCAAIWLLPEALSYLPATKRLVVFGSTSVFGKQDSKNKAEQDVVGKLHAAEEKIIRAAAEKRIDFTILRPTMIYGMGMDANITRLARVIKKFGVLPIAKPANGLRAPVHAVDLAWASLAVMDNEKTFGKAYNLEGGERLTYRAMTEKIFLKLGRAPRLLSLPFLAPALDLLGGIFPFLHINGEVARRMNTDLVFDKGDALHDFGYRPRGFLEGDFVL